MTFPPIDTHSHEQLFESLLVSMRAAYCDYFVNLFLIWTEVNWTQSYPLDRWSGQGPVVFFLNTKPFKSLVHQFISILVFICDWTHVLRMINTLGLNCLLIDWRVCLLFRLFQTDPLFLKFSADPVYHNLDHFRLGPSQFRDTPQRRFHKKLRNSLLQPFKLHSSRHLGRYLWHFAFVYCRHLHSLSVCLAVDYRNWSGFIWQRLHEWTKMTCTRRRDIFAGPGDHWPQFKQGHLSIMNTSWCIFTIHQYI